MPKPRRRKTPVTAIAAKIRAYAVNYAASGQKEHAAGMVQAADMIDELSARGGGLLEPVRTAQVSGMHGSAFALLEARVARLEAVGPGLSQPSEKASRRGDDQTQEMDRKTSRGHRTPHAMAQTLGGEVSLTPGEERILAAVAQSRYSAGNSEDTGRSNDELTAMVDYRATSLRTYLGNLRAAGYVETVQGRHLATQAGRARVEHYERLPVGDALYKWWSEKLTGGEATILRSIEAHRGGARLDELCGVATGLKATSVRTYAGALLRRRLIVRTARGCVALAQILIDGGLP
jgi:hypothetical protein